MKEIISIIPVIVLILLLIYYFIPVYFQFFLGNKVLQSLNINKFWKVTFIIVVCHFIFFLWNIFFLGYVVNDLIATKIGLSYYNPLIEKSAIRSVIQFSVATTVAQLLIVSYQLIRYNKRKLKLDKVK